MLQRRVVVSGGDTGIGLATARGFAAAADRVVLDELGSLAGRVVRSTRSVSGLQECPPVGTPPPVKRGRPAASRTSRRRFHCRTRVGGTSDSGTLAALPHGTVGGGLVGHAQRRWTIWLILISP